jgi:hypothetical protein
MHLFLLLFMTSIRFAGFPQGFGAAVHRFWEGKPWESKGRREQREKQRRPVCARRT